MSVGGIIQRANKREPGPVGPPGVVANANNGTSLDTATSTIVQLGQDVGAVGNPATLLSNRDIPFDSKVLNFLFAANKPFAQFDGSSTIYLGDVNGNINTGLAFFISPTLEQSNIYDNNGTYLDIAPGGYGFGDLNGAYGTGALRIQSGIDFIELGDILGGAGDMTLVLDNLLGAEQLRVHKGGFNYLAMDFPSATYKFGDISSTLNGNALSIDDTNESVIIGSQGNSNFSILSTSIGAEDYEVNFGTAFLILNKSTGLYEIGDTATSLNGTRLSLDDTNSLFDARADGKFDFHDTGNFSFLTIEPGPASVLIGDIDGKANSTIFTVADNTKSITAEVNASKYLNIDVLNNIYSLGDVANLIGPYLNMNTSAGSAFIDLYAQLPGGNPYIDFFGQATGAGGSYLQLDVNNTMILKISETAALTLTGDTTLIHTGTALANGAAAQVGTLNNAPAAGNPTKWIPIDDNGTTRYIPAW